MHKNSKRHAKATSSRPKLRSFIEWVVLPSIFLLELLVAIGVGFVQPFKMVAMILALILAGLYVLVNLMSWYMSGLKRGVPTKYQAFMRSLDHWACFFLFAVSISGMLWVGAVVLALWANVLISLRWLYDAWISHYQNWRIRNKKVLTDADCPEKID